jgi:hypothetical protein
VTDSSGGSRQFTEQELVAGLMHTLGVGPGKAAEIAAWHFGHGHRCLPDDAHVAMDPRDVWKRS